MKKEAEKKEFHKMSSDSHILGASTVTGSTAGAVAAAAHSNHALLIGIAVGLAVLLILGFAARRLTKRS
ncbi:MAG TPA: hypothetical protein VGM08_00275 [Candidatus Saccharimonadales bacterium]